MSAGPDEQPRRLRGTFLQASDGSWFWAPQPTAPTSPPAPVEGQLLRPVGEETVFGFDGTSGGFARTIRTRGWVDAYTGLPARGGPR